MYRISDYGDMIANTSRKDAYVQALRQAVRPGCIVLEIGTGTGFFALLACQFGAGRVYGIEPNAAIHVARQLAAANGYSEQMVLFQDLSTHTSLPERVDVIISDLRGILPLRKGHIAAIVDARQRFLAPHGVLIPQRDTLWAAVVAAPDFYRRLRDPWDANEYGLNLQAARHLVMNNWYRKRFTPAQCLTEPSVWATLDYTTIDSPNIRGELTWTMQTSQTAHGLSAWFDSVLAPGVEFSNAPDAPKLIYHQVFFPWTHPVALKTGDRVSVSLRAHVVQDTYLWSWNSRILTPEDQVKADFKQSTFQGTPLASSQFRQLDVA